MPRGGENLDLDEEDDRVRVLRRIDYLESFSHRRCTVKQLNRDLDLSRDRLQRLARHLAEEGLVNADKADGSTGRGPRGNSFSLTEFGETVLDKVLK